MQGPKAKVVKTFKFTLPEGRSIGENVPLVEKGPFDGLLRARRPGAPAPCAARTTLGAAAQRQERRGLPVPRDLRDDRRRERERPRQAPARRLRGERRQGADEDRQAAQPDALRRADHRLDGRARGAARARAPADRRGHPQPPHARASRSGSTPPSATTSTTGRGRCASPSSSATRPTTRARAAACRRRRSATRASPRSAPPPTPPRRSTCSSCASPASPASTRSRRPTPSSSATWRATRPPAAVLDDLPRRLRVARGPLALAGDAERRAAGRGPRPTGSTSRCRCRRSCSPRPCARCPRRASAAST